MGGVGDGLGGMREDVVCPTIRELFVCKSMIFALKGDQYTSTHLDSHPLHVAAEYDELIG